MRVSKAVGRGDSQTLYHPADRTSRHSAASLGAALAIASAYRPEENEPVVVKTFFVFEAELRILPSNCGSWANFVATANNSNRGWKAGKQQQCSKNFRTRTTSFAAIRCTLTSPKTPSCGFGVFELMTQ
jgi:hypothetical protein